MWACGCATMAYRVAVGAPGSGCTHGMDLRIAENIIRLAMLKFTLAKRPEAFERQDLKKPHRVIFPCKVHGKEVTWR